MTGSPVMLNADDLDELNARFDQQLAEIERPLTDLNKGYRAALEKQLAVYRESGNANAVKEVEDELLGFPEGPGLSLYHLELQRLQQVYRQQRQDREQQVFAPRLQLFDAYRERLEALKMKFVQAGGDVAKVDESLIKLLELESQSARGTWPGQVATRSGIRLCWVPAGRFTMGSPPDEPNRKGDEDQVEVTLSQGFWMGAFELTNEQYISVMQVKPIEFQPGLEEHPVVKVTWLDAAAFCEKLTEKSLENGTLPRGWRFSLPTEAQWEYACRAGSKGLHQGMVLDEVAWHQGNRESRDTHEVGRKKPNHWGIHDMLGNVSEWCWDYYDDLKGGTDPTGPDEKQTNRVTRGSDSSDAPDRVRVAARGLATAKDNIDGESEYQSFDNLGFRVVLIRE